MELISVLGADYSSGFGSDYQGYSGGGAVKSGGYGGGSRSAPYGSGGGGGKILYSVFCQGRALAPLALKKSIWRREIRIDGPLGASVFQWAESSIYQ